MATATLDIQHLSRLRDRIETEISRHRGWYILQSAVFIVAGILAIILPGLTAIGFGLVIGALLLVSGIVQAVASIRSRLHWWSLVSAVASILAGGLTFFYPIAGTIAIATILAVFLLVEGIAEILLAFQFRPAKSWGWLLASGVIALVLSVLLFAGWPQATVTFMGIVIGLNLILYGIALLALMSSVHPHPTTINPEI